MSNTSAVGFEARHRAKSRWTSTVATAVGIVVLASAPLACRSELPRFAIEGPFGGVREERGPDEAASFTFVKSSLVRFDIRPERKPDRSVYAAMYVEAPSGKLRRAPADAVIPTRSGGFSIEAEGQALFREGTGAYRLHVLVSDESSFPEEPTASGLLSISGLQPVVTVPVRFEQS